MERRQFFACADWRAAIALGVSVVLYVLDGGHPSRAGVLHKVPGLAAAVQGELATLGATGAQFGASTTGVCVKQA